VEHGVAAFAGASNRLLVGDVSRPAFDAGRPPWLIAAGVSAEDPHFVSAAVERPNSRLADDPRSSRD
jgi:hypothetical protein